MMKTVLITGATGFIGRNCLAPLLEKGYRVHATFARTTGNESPHIEWHQANILDANQISNLQKKVHPTHLLHLAWDVTPGEFWTSPQNLQWVSASLHLLKEFAANGGHRVVMAGTCAEYDWTYGYCSERTTPLAPSTLYGNCKGALRSILESFSEQVGLSCAWGRIFFPYGPNEHPNRLVASVIQNLLAGKRARCTAGTQFRDLLHVQDVAEAFVELLDSDQEGAVNIGSGKPVMLRDVVSTIGQMMSRSDLLDVGALPMRENDPPLVFADVRKLKTLLNWTPRYDMESGLEHTIRWWKNAATNLTDDQRRESSIGKRNDHVVV